MSEPKKKENELKPDASKMAAFSDKREDLLNALDMLYIYGNASGRNKFREKWPDVAAYIYGDTLIKYDNEGVEDIELRKKLEEEADSRRFFLKETIEDMVEKSVDSGVLQFDYVGKVVDVFGPILSTLLYSKTVIERVRPGFLDGAVSFDDAKAAKAYEDGLSVAEKQALAEKKAEESEKKSTEEILDDVTPIDTKPDHDDLDRTENVSLNDDSLDDIIPPLSEQDDMQSAENLSIKAAQDLFPENQMENGGRGSNPAPQIEKEAEAESPEADRTDKLKSLLNPAPPPVDSVAPVAPDIPADSPAPQAPPAGMTDIPLGRPPEEVNPSQVSPEEAPAVSPSPEIPVVQAQPAAEIPLDVPPAEIDLMGQGTSSLDSDALDEIKPIDVGATPPSDLQSELIGEEQLPPDEGSPPQEEPQAEGLQSQEQPEDTTEEPKAESKVDSVSFAGRETRK